MLEVSALIGHSTAHRSLLEVLRKVAPTDAEVLLSGPSGVGKELYARYTHEYSRRRGGRFVPVNCGSLSEGLLENELFGHVGGAFTGARPQHEGLVREAEGGTLFLDEVDALPPASQVKLLRFMQDKEYRRLGESRLRHADVRVVSATNADLVDEVCEGRFREDLFFRLRVIPLEVPPLAARPADIPPLLEASIRRYAREYQLPPVVLKPRTVERLTHYAWPGNVRELENCVRYLTCLQLGRPVMLEDIPLLVPVTEDDAQPLSVDDAALGDLPFREAKRRLVQRFERSYLHCALDGSGGNIARAARASGKPRRAFFELMRKYGVKAEDYRPGTSSVVVRDGRRTGNRP